MTLRRLWNALTKKNSGKSKMKNYDMAEAMVDLIQMIAEERAERGYSEIYLLLNNKADKLAREIIANKKKQPQE